MTDVGLYLHIPFCLAKCVYCDFNSYPQMEGMHERYVQAMCAEIRGSAEQHPALGVDSIYIGGGTPTVLSSSLLTQLLAACRESFEVADDAEISIEANPGTVDQDQLTALCAAGIDRVSLGAQSFNEHELQLLKRIHTVDQTREALGLIRAAGTCNINLDLIYGLPQQSLADWTSTLDQALRLAPEHISLYALSVEEGTPLAECIARGELPPTDDDLAADLYTAAEGRLQEAGYAHYELSNWAVKRTSAAGTPEVLWCRHNLKYWHVDPYLGFGAGAHSHFAGRRFCSVAHPEEYVLRLENGLSPTANTALIGPEESMVETMILGLRLTEGVRFSDFRQRHGRDLHGQYTHALSELAGLGLVTGDDQAIRLTTRGRLLANQVFLRFWPGTAGS
jgi:oxygen-independent coproporphyrinogen-3 oxidase